MNKLYYGDNLTIMQNMNTESVDLIYLDPPFNSNRSYNLLYKNTTGLPVPEQIEAFCDAWDLDYEKSEMAKRIPIIMHEYGIDTDVVKFWEYMIKALKTTNPKMLAYLIYMTVRLVEMHRLLRPTGSLYLHCDPTASHYLKIMLDGIFGHDNFVAEISWKRSQTRSSISRCYRRAHDIILFYTKSSKYTFNIQYKPLSNASLGQYRLKDEKGNYRLVPLLVSGKRNGETGKPWHEIDPNIHGKSGMHWITTHAKLEDYEKQGLIVWPKKAGGSPNLKYYLEQSPGMPINDYWDDIDLIASSSSESLGYPTQKPIALLDRIIRTSSNEGDIVFDPFCGCGTTIESCIQNNRTWIGCDIAIHAVKLIQQTRIKKYELTENEDYTVEGIPQSVEQAQYLFKQDPFQFQHWSVEKTGGFCSTKKTGDSGIDGRLYFEAEGKLFSMVLSVKGGGIHPTDIRDLRGVLEREEETKLAGFISLHEPSKAMRQEADAAGYYEYQGTKYARLQMLTVKDIFDGKFWHCPSVVKIKRKEAGQMYFAI